VIDRSKGLIYGPAAKKPFSSDLEKHEAVLRGLSNVNESSIIPGVGTYDIDLGAKLDAVVKATRQQTQFPTENPITVEGSRSVSMAAAQTPMAPSFSFAATGREERLRLFSGPQFINVGNFSPDTPGHFLTPFPAPTFQPEKTNSSQSYSLGGANVKRENKMQSYTDSFPDHRYEVIDSCAGEQSAASPYSSSSVYTIPKATRTSMAVNSMRSSSSRVDVEAIYNDYRGGIAQSSNNKPSSPLSSSSSSPPKKLRNKSNHKRNEKDKVSSPLSMSQNSYMSSSSSSLQGRQEQKDKQESQEGQHPDRFFPSDSPGPIYYNTLASMEALDMGGVPHKKVGIKITQAKRFEAFKRNDGTIVEHPFDAIQTQKLLNGNLEVNTNNNKKKTMNKTKNSKSSSLERKGSESISLASTSPVMDKKKHQQRDSKKKTSSTVGTQSKTSTIKQPRLSSKQQSIA